MRLLLVVPRPGVGKQRVGVLSECLAGARRPALRRRRTASVVSERFSLGPGPSLPPPPRGDRPCQPFSPPPPNTGLNPAHFHFAAWITNGTGGAAWIQEVSSPWTVPRSRKSAISFVSQLPAPAWVPRGILTSRPFGKPEATRAASAGGVTGSRSPEKRRTGTSEWTRSPSFAGRGAWGQAAQTASWSRT